jgi:hypothetical protein
MPNPAILKGRLYQVIHEHGPMTYEALAQYMQDVSVENIKSCINEDRRKRIKKVFRVVDWRRNIGVRGRPSPIVGLGPEPDAPLPDFTNQHLLAQRRYNEKRAIKQDTTMTESVREEVIKEIEVVQATEVNAGHVGTMVFDSMFAPPTPVKLPSTTTRKYRMSKEFKPSRFGRQA